ncbi:YbaB/EbfC family nucleoid-associated protein [Micromonospora endolithica]|uniref:YbaB/EbfC family nucleoid-associated protein n=1 Tax=Micromonospora endolithica TaxID=230091 RepID=UPI001EE113B1|nr:YbaB/EbfC family nucleoid-associated protein [Micromonospora endolithica]
MTHASELNKSISDMLAALGRSTVDGDAGQSTEPSTDVRGVGEAADGKIRVVAVPGGEVESVWIDPRLMRTPSETLAEEIRLATNAALADLRAALAGALPAPDTTAVLAQLQEVQRTAVPQLQGFIDALTGVQERLANGRRP